jgi:GSCFA family
MTELFRTPVKITPLEKRFNHDAVIFMIGSCFSENIYLKLKNYKFNVSSNPSGIIYNPVSIASSICRLIKNKPYNDEELFCHDGLYRSFDHHTSFSDTDKYLTLRKINDSFTSAQELLRHSNLVMITLGSAFVYQLRENQRIVANCHKLPDSKFIRRLLTINEIVDSLKNTVDALLQLNPAMHVVFTVSPVRHLRDNAHENCVSKAYLIASINQLQTDYTQISCFPSYEIMLDELRDYRFYNADMVHPSDVAIDFIWNRFCKFCFDNKTLDFIRMYQPVLASMNHRIQTDDTVKIAQFTDSVKRMIDTIRAKFPGLHFENEYSWLENCCK